LFGHVRGAFTGAAIDRAGAFQRASGGTIFLDELSGISLKAQARLLRVLEERRVRPVGSDREVEIDVRVVAASTRGLEQRVAEGSFRPDLFYRLAVVRVQLPPLRARREDIPLIVEAMMRQRGLESGEVAGDNLHRLMAHTWPGNVRELRNIIERAIALSPGARSFEGLRLAVYPQEAEEQLTVRTDLPYSEAKRMLLEVFEYRYLNDLITRCEGNISVASREANIDRKHLRDLLRRNGLVD
jgi:DNA-binding NtrC family response regulator